MITWTIEHCSIEKRNLVPHDITDCGFIDDNIIRISNFFVHLNAEFSTSECVWKMATKYLSTGHCPDNPLLQVTIRVQYSLVNHYFSGDRSKRQMLLKLQLFVIDDFMNYCLRAVFLR